MNLKQLSAHVNDNIQNDRPDGHRLLHGGKPEIGDYRMIFQQQPELYTLAPVQ